MSAFLLEPVYDDEGHLVQLVPRRRERAPRFRYFQSGAGPIFGWLTEPLEGRFASMVWVPVGPGARSGRAEEWAMVEAATSVHRLRKDAKARALRLYRAHEAGDPRPW